MKKFILLLTVAVLCLAMAACGNKDAAQAFEIYSQMEETVANASSLEMVIDGAMVMSSGSESIDVAVGVNMKQVIRSETDVDLEMTMDMAYTGMSLTSVIYYKDGYMYQDIMGQKLKTVADVEEVMDQSYSSGLKITEALIKTSKVEKVDGGNKVTFTLKEEAANDMLGEIVDSMLQGMDMTGVTTKMGDVQCTALVDEEGYPKTYNILFDFSMEQGGETVKFDYDMTTEYVSFDSIDAIEFPADLDTYIEY